MERLVIEVRAAEGGWSVTAEVFRGPLMFLSGARAEREACRLAKAASAVGRESAVLVHDRSGQLIACIDVGVGLPSPVLTHLNLVSSTPEPLRAAEIAASATHSPQLRLANA
jgi:hypothetical protein